MGVGGQGEGGMGLSDPSEEIFYLSRTVVALALTWSFAKITLGVEAHGFT